MDGKRGSNGAGVSVMKVMVVLMVMSGGGGALRAVQALSPRECKLEKNILVAACQSVVHKKPPSAYCCDRLRAAHEECVCPVITPQLAALIDVNYAIKVVQSCGRPVPRHYKCGSITTP